MVSEEGGRHMTFKDTNSSTNFIAASNVVPSMSWLALMPGIGVVIKFIDTPNLRSSQCCFGHFHHSKTRCLGPSGP